MPESASVDRPQPTPLDLFVSFARVSALAFGGVLPWARRMIVEQKRWMTAEEFNEAFSVCQFLPGPNIVNFSIYFGARCAGPLGAIGAFAGVLVPSMLLVMLLGAFYVNYGSMEAVARVLNGLAAAAAGLVIGVSLKMAEPLAMRWRHPNLYAALAIFLAVGIFRVPLLWALLVGTPVCILLAWWARR